MKMETNDKLEALLPSLHEENKFKRRNALRELKQLTTELQVNEKEDLINVFSKTQTAIFSSLSDKSEINRTEAATILILLIENNCVGEKSLCTLISIMHHRIGKLPFAEDSEDVQLELLRALNLTLKCDIGLWQHFSDVVDILVLCLQEKCPDILLIACECVDSLSVAEKVKFHMQSESLIKPLIKCLSYQRFKIRCKALETIGNVLINGDSTSFGKLTEPLGLCVKDIAQVRLQLVKLGNRLAKEFSERYSYWAKILPLVLFGLKDADNEVNTYTTTCWTEIGAQYERENEVEQEIKFYMPKENFIDGERQYGIGCQLLVQKSLSYLIPCIDLSIDDWQEETRLRAVQLLSALIINGQESIVQYASNILPILCITANDREIGIRNEGLLACKYFGFFVSPKIYLKIMEQQLHTGTAYLVLLSLLSGTTPDLLQEYVTEVVQLLRFNEFDFNVDLYQPIVGIISLLSSSCDVKTVCHDLLLPLLYFSSCGDLDGKACVLALDTLADKCNFCDVPAMMNSYSESIMRKVEKSATLWDEFSPQFLVYLSLSRFGGVGGNLEIVGNICSAVMNRKECPIVKYKFIDSMQNLILKRTEPINNLVEEWLAYFISEYINKLLVWSPSRTTEAMRTAAVSFLLSVTAHSEHSSVLCQALRTSVTYIPELITDESEETRYLTCKFIQCICKNPNIHLDNKVLLSLSEILIKRLDDKKSPVRLMASETLPVTMTLDATSTDEVTDLVASHIKSVLIYLDEDDVKVRQNIVDTLRRAGEICPQYLLKTLQENGHKFRNEDVCKQLIRELSELKVKQ